MESTVEGRKPYGSPRGDHDEADFSGRRSRGKLSDGYPAPRVLRPISWIVVLLILAFWSIVSWVGYASVDPVLGWAAANVGAMLEGGKNIVTATGVGKEIGSVVDSLNVSGLLGQAIALLLVVVKPLIIIVWAIGAIAVVASPVILPKLGRFRARRRF